MLSLLGESAERDGCSVTMRVKARDDWSALRSALERERRPDRDIEGVVPLLAVGETVAGIVEPGVAELAVEHDAGTHCIFGCGDHAVEVPTAAGIGGEAECIDTVVMAMAALHAEGPGVEV